MAEIYFSLGDLYQEQWGYKSEAFDPKPGAVKGVKEFSRLENGVIGGSAYYAKDIVGREYYLPIEVNVGNDNAEAFGVTNSSGAYTGRWYLPYPVLTIDTRMKLIKTDLTERNGPVIELINMGGWEINIRGFFINKVANEFPADDYATMIRLIKLKKVFRINNPVTDMAFLINGTGEKEVVIEDFKLLDGRGKKRVRGYELKLFSNEPFNLTDISGGAAVVTSVE